MSSKLMASSGSSSSSSDSLSAADALFLIPLVGAGGLCPFVCNAISSFDANINLRKTVKADEVSGKGRAILFEEK